MSLRPEVPLRVAVVALAAVTLLAGCREDVASLDPAGVPAPIGDGPPTTLADFDPEAVREALQGDWVVRRGDRTLYEFRIDGERAAVVDHRFAEARVREGDLVIRSPTGFGVEGEDGTTRYFSFVRTGERVFMGLGAAIEAERGEPFVARLGAWEKLVHDGETCRYVRTWAGETTEEEVECGFDERGERTVFHFEGPDPFREDRKRRQEWYVEGGYLLDRELALSTTRRRGAPEAATLATDADAEADADADAEAGTVDERSSDVGPEAP